MRLDRRTFLQSSITAGAAAIAPWRQTAIEASTPVASPVPALPPDEDGYDLWLRYRAVDDAGLLEAYRRATTSIVNLASDPIAQSISSEIDRACKAMLGQSPTVATTIDADGTILIGTPKSSKTIADTVDAKALAALGDEGFILKSAKIGGHRGTIIAANTDRGLIYGAFAFLKKLQLREAVDSLDITDMPRANLRFVNHWDDFNRTVTRGYAGLSIFQFADLSTPNQRYEDYARLLASVGINGTVINNVNASSVFLESKMMPGYASLAATLRGWGIRLFISVNFASPIDLTKSDATPITTADPEDPNVQQWWSAKIDEIYQAVPDFGGFLVKANSEGEPGPITYNRTHAQGANMLAGPLDKHGGILIWRSFVHKGFKGWAEYEYNSFQPLDGQFASNAIIQTKNGPIDFQAREPTNPLFGALPKTNQMIELQITQEYTGHATHLCYLPTYWSLILGFDTKLTANGPTVASIIDGTADSQPLTGFAGVINFGDDRNWTGSYLSAANTHGFARLAWDHTLKVEDIATEWTKLTFGPDKEIVSTLVPMLHSSWQIYLNYTTPFGVGYMMRPTGAHFLPDPRETEKQSHITDSKGSGNDRTLATGSGFTRLYSDYWFDQYEKLDSCPEDLMMFMHVVPWDHKLSNGSTTIQQMYDSHFTGVEQVRAMQQSWLALKDRVDRHRFDAISRQFVRHEYESRVWRDVMISYYFDKTRTVSSSKPWIQLELKDRPTMLFGGAKNDLALQLANATGSDLSIKTQVDPARSGWTSTTAETKIKSTESAEGGISITPPLEPSLGGITFVTDASSVANVGFATQTMIVTPDASQCTFALDVGTKPESVVPGYHSLRAADAWTDSASVGWVGKPPNDTWLGAHWGLLLNHCVSGGAPHVLRLKIPAGSQRAWALIGGQGSGTQPVRIRMGNTTLAETEYLEESAFKWAGFTLDGGKNGTTVDLTFEGANGRVWRLSTLVILKPGL